MKLFATRCTREKRMRGEVEDDDVMKREIETTEERKTWTMWTYDEVMNGEKDGQEPRKVDSDEPGSSRERWAGNKSWNSRQRSWTCSSAGARRSCRGGKQPTTTKWVDRWKMDGKGGLLVRCKLVRRDFKVKGVGETEREKRSLWVYSSKAHST